MSLSNPTETTREKVVRIVAQELGAEPGSLRPDSDLRQVEGATSVKVLRAVAKVERSFDIELDDEEIFGAATVEDVVRIVEKAVGQAS